MRWAWAWSAVFLVTAGTSVIGVAQQPAPPADRTLAAPAVSICTQWQQIQRLRTMSPAEGRMLPAFEVLRPFCAAVQQRVPLRISPAERQRLINSACQDWRQLVALQGRNPATKAAPALPEFARTCAQPVTSEMMKYTCTKTDTGTKFSSCCCLGELDCALADKIGSCTNDCRGAKELCERNMKGVFQVLSN